MKHGDEAAHLRGLQAFQVVMKIQQRVNGMRVVAQRRAGQAPLVLKRVEVVRR
jgi:hypothetical protein